ncbi:hypothetical protein SO694_00079188 [Aureococcus anophagefferens]|uniref:ABC-2 type transporter transmembrane domain-containing protein n=1 Tax=Aureococcus anophagefferens TaxID=44056 RepID=A0ABR1FGY3_AURAN
MNSLEAIPQLFARRAAYTRERDATPADAVSPPLEAVVAAASRLPLLAGSLLVFSAIAVPLLGFLAAPAHAATLTPDEEPCGFWDTGGCDGGTPTAAKLRFFGQVYAVVLAFQWTAYWAALALACACPSAAVALGAFLALLMVNLTLSGFNVPLPGLSKPLRVLAAASPCRYAFEALCALALRPWPGGGALDFYFGATAAEPLAPCLLALCGCGAAALAGVYAALAAAPPAPRRPARVLAARGAARLARERAYLAACACSGSSSSGVARGALRDVERDACAASYDALGLLFFVLLFVVMTQVQSVALVFGERTRSSSAWPWAKASAGALLCGDVRGLRALRVLQRVPGRRRRRARLRLGGGDGRRVAR